MPIKHFYDRWVICDERKWSKTDHWYNRANISCNSDHCPQSYNNSFAMLKKITQFLVSDGVPPAEKKEKKGAKKER